MLRGTGKPHLLIMGFLKRKTEHHSPSDTTLLGWYHCYYCGCGHGAYLDQQLGWQGQPFAAAAEGCSATALAHRCSALLQLTDPCLHHTHSLLLFIPFTLHMSLAKANKRDTKWTLIEVVSTQDPGRSLLHQQLFGVGLVAC